ncbi:hypothetical protein CFP65_3219 [Kitasatospora sp. MMS16-BH015]|uniref:DUF1254 domain-containing protein n=1 Tax=Kitasatospora sp. MMS16-BH015 TaxID=2018025 RepID=UPI000CA279A2|nr:DUF1254 domain-containing protein [Kitasatospora sp. MMS16-BH015]AUG78023.1 hypothetical protein CFP65_3219 [Kitasatospora sp. MMS16-BH015]
MGNPALVDPATVRKTAAEAWIWGYPLLENYRTLYSQALDEADPRYVGGFGVFRHYPEPFSSANADVIAPSTDTPYSWAWLDLRAEPWVLDVPDFGDRYHLLSVHDLDTAYVGFIGARTTGPGPGRYLIAGPRFTGDGRQGFDGVLRAETQLVGVIGRTYLAGEADVPAVEELQRGCTLRPLSAVLATAPPPAAPDPVWPVWREEIRETLDWFVLLDFLLGFFPPLPTEADLRRRLAELGIGSGDFEPAALPLELREALREGIADARATLTEAAAGQTDSVGLFGTRVQLGDDYLARAMGAYLGLYGLPAEEAWYGGWLADDLGHRPPDGSRRHTLHFPADGLPPARHFWSVTVYRLPDRLLVPNPAARYAVGSRTPGLAHAPDGSLTLHLQPHPPTSPAEAANWLPTPPGPFTVLLRIYGPRPAALDGRWQLPPLTTVD